MKKLNCVAAILVAACAASIAIDPAAATKKHVKQTSAASGRTAHSSLRAQCHKEAGAYYARGQGWYYQGGLGTAQEQRFYDCLDRQMKSR
jgi:hypothetical protein